MTPDIPDDRFVADVLARTSGAVCVQARRLAGGAADEPLGAADQALLAEHLRHCAACRAVTQTLVSLASTLPVLADEAPGPDFADVVLAATSRRRRERRWHERWRDRWTAAAARPRFAWEVAYALTIVLVVLVGDPVRAWQSTAGRLERWTPPALTLPLRDAPVAALARADGLAWPRIDTAREWLDTKARTYGRLRTGDEPPVWARLWAALTDTADRWRLRVLDWIGLLLDVFEPTTTEPASAPARSGDRTETTP